jgi:hypothetical protein
MGRLVNRRKPAPLWAVFGLGFALGMLTLRAIAATIVGITEAGL